MHVHMHRRPIAPGILAKEPSESPENKLSCFISVWACRRVLALLMIWYLAVHSLPAHKEFRFLLPAFPALMPYAGLALARAWHALSCLNPSPSDPLAASIYGFGTPNQSRASPTPKSPSGQAPTTPNQAVSSSGPPVVTRGPGDHVAASRGPRLGEEVGVQGCSEKEGNPANRQGVAPGRWGALGTGVQCPVGPKGGWYGGLVSQWKLVWLGRAALLCVVFLPQILLGAYFSLVHQRSPPSSVLCHPESCFSSPVKLSFSSVIFFSLANYGHLSLSGQSLGGRQGERQEPGIHIQPCASGNTFHPEHQEGKKASAGERGRGRLDRAIRTMGLGTVMIPSGKPYNFDTLS